MVEVVHMIKVTVHVEIDAYSELAAIIRFKDDGTHEIEVKNPLVWKFAAASPCYMFQHNDTPSSVNPRYDLAMSLFPNLTTDQDKIYTEKAMDIINQVHNDIPDDKIQEEYEALVKEIEENGTGSKMLCF